VYIASGFPHKDLIFLFFTPFDPARQHIVPKKNIKQFIGSLNGSSRFM